MITPAQLLRRLVVAQAGDEAAWVAEQLDALAAGATERVLHIFLGLAPRRLGKADLALTPADRAEADAAVPGWRLDGWSLDGAARVLGLMVHVGQRPFAERFKDLRRTADVAEMVALYRGLPLYPDPASLHFEVGEGLRSTIRPVFEAIAHHNPYPRDHFDEHRWNHMILKALFIGAPLAPVVGLEARANPELARILLDYAEERWAAGRPVAQDLWLPVRPFAADPAIRARLDAACAAGRLHEEALS
ncbi:MAG: hypothetical protein CVT86_02695 [Alphaproteobacteria bacterium HGW-Alphaproteobacteria-8]|jgi:hypothetical protein|nr:MAG: hypothetical protein CVT86_02695 [Alphaproteobacteria bacterium HGW-Alphaproteobacteria-8]